MLKHLFFFLALSPLLASTPPRVVALSIAVHSPPQDSDASHSTPRPSTVMRRTRNAGPHKGLVALGFSPLHSAPMFFVSPAGHPP